MPRPGESADMPATGTSYQVDCFFDKKGLTSYEYIYIHGGGEGDTVTAVICNVNSKQNLKYFFYEARKHL